MMPYLQRAILFVILFSAILQSSLAQCDIRDVVTTASDCDNEGFFSVLVDFNFNEVSDSFLVNGNGVGYGTFAYVDIPITIFELQGNCETRYEFIVIDSQDPDCSDYSDLGIVCCDTDMCMITDLAVTEMDCLENGHYNLMLDFDIANPNNDFYEVWINGDYVGFFLLSDRPHTFEDISPRSNTDYDIVRVCINDHPDCCAVLEYLQPECDPTTCSIGDLQVDLTTCTEDGLFAAIISFDYTHASDSFEVRGNGNLYGTYAYAELPISIDGLIGDCETIYEFVVIDIEQGDCASDIDLGVVCCDTDMCMITNLAVTEMDCLENGHYNLMLDFDIANPNNDFYEVWINGDYVGFFLLSDRPHTFEDISPRSNTDYDIVRVCINDHPDCCAVLEYLQPECDPTTCSIGDLQVDLTTCTEDGLFAAIISFDYTHASDSFEVRGNGNLYGTYAYAELPITIDGLIGDCETNYEFVVIDIEQGDCASDIDLGVVCCDTDMCMITDLAVTEMDCLENGHYNFILNFNYTNPGNASYDIWINNEFAGFYALSDLPQLFEDISPRANTDYDIVRVCINDHPDCCAVLEYQQPECLLTSTLEVVQDAYDISVISNQINIDRSEIGSDGYEIRVFDLLGRIHFLDRATINHYSSDLSAWQSGVYIIVVTDDNYKLSKMIWLSE